MKTKPRSVTTAIVLGIVAMFVIGGVYIAGHPRNLAAVQEQKLRAEASPATIADLVGQPLPSFSLRDKNGAEYSSENLRGKNFILFFNEGLMCYPSCWNQIVALAQDKRLQGSDIVALSVVTDDPGGWQRAIQKMPELGYAKTLFDTDKTVSRRLSMLTTNSSMHYGSYPGHSYLVVDRGGIVRYAYDDPRMAINNDLIANELAKLQ